MSADSNDLAICAYTRRRISSALESKTALDREQGSTLRNLEQEFPTSSCADTTLQIDVAPGMHVR